MNSVTSINGKIAAKFIIIDFLVWLCVACIPAISHWLPIPLYLFEPMRIFLFLGFFLTNDKRNGYLLAITIPFVSLVLSGHPTVFKALLISFELSLNVFLVTLFIREWKKPILALLLSVLISKLFYYLVKFIFISTSLLEGKLITTPIGYQLVSGVIVAAIFFVLVKTRILKI